MCVFSVGVRIIDYGYILCSDWFFLSIAMICTNLYLWVSWHSNKTQRLACIQRLRGY